MRNGITNSPDKESDYISIGTQLSPHGELLYQVYRTSTDTRSTKIIDIKCLMEHMKEKI